MGGAPVWLTFKITPYGDKDLIISAVPAGPCFLQGRYFNMKTSIVLGIAQTLRCGFIATAVLLAL